MVLKLTPQARARIFGEPLVKVETPPVEKKEPPVQKPVKKKKKVVVKKKKRDRRPNKKEIRRVGLNKSQLEATQIYFNSLPIRLQPIVRGVFKMLSIDPDSIPTNRAQAVKNIVEIATNQLGSDDPEKIFNWVNKKLKQHRIAGDRPEAKLLMMLKLE